MWTEGGHLNREERNTPEIQRSDLAEVVLLLHSLGIREAATFDWLLARAFKGLSLVKEAQAAPLVHAFHRHLEKGQIEWHNELLPPSIPWLDNGTTKVSYANGSPETQVKLQECWALAEHPTLCEGRLPVLLKLCTPSGKVIATTTDWTRFLAREWRKHRPIMEKKFPGHVWR